MMRRDECLSHAVELERQMETASVIGRDELPQGVWRRLQQKAPSFSSATSGGG